MRNPPFRADNYKSATVAHLDQCAGQFDKLIADGIVEPVTDPEAIAALVVSPIGAADKKDNGVILPEKRLYLDLSRHVNWRLQHLEMHLPSIDDALRTLPPGGWMAKLDLSAAFHHVRIAPSSRRIFGCFWRGKFYQYTRMNFGLSTAPRHWQYIMDRVASYLTSTFDILVLVYLDDFLITGATQAECQRAVDIVRRELAELGLKVNERKSIAPTQACRFLGLLVDSVKMEITLPEEKRSAIIAELDSFRARYASSSRASLSSLLSLVGRLSHAAKAVRAARPFLRRMWDLFRAQRSAWAGDLLRVSSPDLIADGVYLPAGSSSPPFKSRSSRSRSRRLVHLSPGFWADLSWWSNFMASWPGTARWLSGPDHICFTDACTPGFGGHTDTTFFFGRWPASMSGRHINWKELRAVEIACLRFGAGWSGGRVLFAVDSSAALGILNSGTSPNPALMDVRRRIAYLAAIYSFDLRAVHIPGIKNVFADCLSRLLLPSNPAPLEPEPQEWSLSDSLLSDALRSPLSDPLIRQKLSGIANPDFLSSVVGRSDCSPQARAVYETFVRDLRPRIQELEQVAWTLNGTDPAGLPWVVPSRLPVALCTGGAPGPTGQPADSLSGEHSDPCALRPSGVGDEPHLPRLHARAPPDTVEAGGQEAPLSRTLAATMVRDRGVAWARRVPRFPARLCSAGGRILRCAPRSELAALNVGDICFKSQRQLGGVYFNMARLRIRRSKTDQAGAGQEVLLFEASPASCPLRALRSVLHLRPPDRMEPLFVKPSGKRISEGYVNRLVKRVISMVAPGHDPARYGAHSLRRGGLTALACAGVLPALVQRHARHKDPRSTLGYTGAATRPARVGVRCYLIAALRGGLRGRSPRPLRGSAGCFGLRRASWGSALPRHSPRARSLAARSLRFPALTLSRFSGTGRRG